MAALSGFSTQHAQWAVNPYLSLDFDIPDEAQDVAAQISAHAVFIPLYGAALAAPQYPITTAPRRILGALHSAYAADYYHRIHVFPTSLDLGNLVSAQVTSVRVWNAYMTAKNLSHVDGLEEGLELSGPQAMPYSFPPLLETDWQLNVTPDGPAVLDTTLRWMFDAGVQSPGLRVTGNRIVPWGFVPDWSHSITERLSWLTDILANSRGAEQRRSLRLAPRKSYEARFVVDGPERAFFDLAMAGWGRKVWAMPVWPDVQLLAAPVPAASLRIACRTVGFDFRKGGLAMLRGESAFDTEAVEIAAIDATGLELKRATQQSWPAQTRLYPVRSARLSAMPETERHSDRLITTEAVFELVEPADWPTVLPSTLYRGRPVFDARPNETQNLTRGYERLTLQLDNLTGIPALADTAGKSFVLQQHRWALAGRVAQGAWRSLLYALRGRAVSVWLPTHAQDLQLAQASEGSVLKVRKVGYARFGAGALGRRDIRIELADGTVLLRRIQTAVENGAIEELAIDADLPRNIAPEEVLRISYMALCRLADDTVELQHITDADGHAASSVMWRGVRDDLEGA